MSVNVFPTTLYASKMSWSQQRCDAEFRSAFGAQAVEVSPPLWAITIEAPNMRDSKAGAWKALVMQLRGKTNQLAMYDPMRPVPTGTLRGTLVLAVAAAQGDVGMSLSGGTAGGTLKAGDLLGIGSNITQQVVMVSEDALADGSGNIDVVFEPPLRNAFDLGAAVTWDHPAALFRRKDSNTGWDYAPGIVSGFVMQLIEDWRT